MPRGGNIFRSEYSKSFKKFKTAQEIYSENVKLRQFKKEQERGQFTLNWGLEQLTDISDNSSSVSSDFEEEDLSIKDEEKQLRDDGNYSDDLLSRYEIYKSTMITDADMLFLSFTTSFCCFLSNYKYHSYKM